MARSPSSGATGNAKFYDIASMMVEDDGEPLLSIKVRN